MMLFDDRALEEVLVSERRRLHIDFNIGVSPNMASGVARHAMTERSFGLPPASTTEIGAAFRDSEARCC